MCEYCGCQTIDAIAALTREHDEIRTVARDAAAAARAGDRGAAADVARRLITLLAPHVEIEERGLFPAMAVEFAEHVGSLEAEHRDLEDTLGRIADLADTDPGWSSDLTAAIAGLFRHILREQDGLFPASLTVLTAADWDVLDSVRVEVTAPDRPV